MKKNDLFSQFTQRSEYIKSQIDIISISLTEEKLPDESAVRDVMTGIENLRSIHQQIREYAASVLPADEIPAEDSPVSNFRTAIEQSLAFQIQQKIDEIGKIVHKFLTVYSNVPDSAAELKKHQDQAASMLKELQETRQISNEIEKYANAYSAFLTLVQMQDSQSDEWYDVFEPLDDSNVFSKLIMRRLPRHDFLLPDENVSNKNPVVEEVKPASENAEIQEPGNDTQPEKNDTDVNPETSEDILLSPRKPIKQKTASTGAFMKIVQRWQDPFDIAILLPLIYQLGAVPVEALTEVWDILALHSPMFRFVEKYFEEHPGDRKKYTEEKPSDTNESGKSTDDLLSLLEYLEISNVASLYDLPDDSGTIVCLTPYAYDCMSKSTIKTQRYTGKGPWHNKPIWVNYFSFIHKFISSEKLSLSELISVSEDNKGLLLYIGLVSFQKDHDDSVLQFMKDIEWDGDHYHVNVYRDNDVFPCSLFGYYGKKIDAPDGILLFAQDNTIVVNQDQNDVNPIFLFTADEHILYERKEDKWIEIYKIHQEDETETSEIQNENQPGAEDDHNLGPEDEAVSPMDEENSDEAEPEEADTLSVNNGEVVPVLHDDGDNLPEIPEDNGEISASEIEILQSEETVPGDSNDGTMAQVSVADVVSDPVTDIENYEKNILLELIEEAPELPDDPEFASLTASQMAAYLYINNVNPEAAYNVPLFCKLIYQLISEKKLSDAVLLSCALASLEEQKTYADFCKLVEASCDIEGSAISYTGTELQNLLTTFENRGYKEEDYILLLTAAIRGLFKPTNESGFTDYQLRDIAMNLIAQDDSLDKNISANIRELMDSLSEMMVSIPGGFSDEVLDTFKKTGTKEKYINALASQAGNLMKTPPNTIQLKDLSTFLREFFGPRSEFYQMLSYVHDGRRDKGEEIAFFLETYLDEYKDFSEDNIKQFVQDQWRSHSGPGFKLQFGGLNNVVRAFSERFTLLDKWIRTVGIDRYTITSEKKTTASKIRTEVIASVKKIIKDLQQSGESSCSTFFALEHLLTRINSILQTEDTSEDGLYLNENYLTYYLIPDENGFPVCDAGFDTVLFYEQWRNILRHILSTKITPAEVIAHVQEDGRQSYWGYNYGSARQLILKNHLEAMSTEEKRVMDHAVFNVTYSEHFVKELEMAVFYGKITENIKDDLMDAESSFRHYFQNSENYGQYRYFLSCLLKKIDLESHRLTIETKLEIDNLPEEIKIGRKDDLEKINILVNNGNFTAADDKLKRLKNYEYDLWLVEEEKSYFDHFLAVYDDIYKALKDSKGVEVATFYGSVLGKNKTWEMELSNAYQKSRKSRRNIFPNWGKENENALTTLFEELDFPVKNVKRDKEYYILAVEPYQKNLPEYPHPIAKFGTLMDEKIRVVCQKGVVTANTINSISKKNSMGGTGIIILADYAIPLDERRKIVEDFMSSDKEYPFIVIDRVLLFYLAAQEQANRMQVLLECTLPFSYTQPYRDGRGDVPDEMFFGRHTELSKIRLSTPACFVYGGRQLGKTVLLKRTANLDNKQEEKQFAVYFDAKDNNVEKTVSQIAGKLQKLNIITNQPKNMGDLCSSIERKLKEEKSVKRLLLLIDEADAYLEDDRENAYEATKKLWDLHREYPYDFKFVFAGLHNVARTAHGSENNSLIGQFNMVSIGQLSKKDAQQLIQKPMRYLGIRLKDEQIASIIENANYYPGVLQFFCHEMLEELYGNYKNHFSSQKGNPPFEIREDNLKRIISKANLSNEIKDRLSLTLKLDSRYMFFANLIAYLYYQDRENGYLNPHGYSIRIIKQYGKEFAPHLSDYDYDQILPEMVEMGILTKDNSQYKLRRASFLEMINDSDAVEEYLLTVEDDKDA